LEPETGSSAVESRYSANGYATLMRGKSLTCRQSFSKFSGL
jgi:hypothetical protein